MRIALTGATGLLGRNLLFEIIKQNIGHLDDLELIVFGRSNPTTSLAQRIQSLFLNDGELYLGQKINLPGPIVPIASDLTVDGLGISSDDIKLLKSKPIDFFFHVAAKTDFRADEAVEEKLEEVNVRGTQRILNLIEGLNVKQLAYVGSAYSCGSKTGLVKPDYINPNEHFRNPYERSKLKAEILAREFAAKQGIKLKVFRPTTICGRLIENPIGGINKFDVFYAWGAFFLYLKAKEYKTLENIYAKPFDIPIRVHFNPRSGLNIVPADYAAKAFYRICLDDWGGDSFHLANNEETPHHLYTSTILEAIGVQGYSFVDAEPADKTLLEKFYYRTVGKLFTPYASGDSIIFDVSGQSEYLMKKGLKCPKIERENLGRLIAYAKSKNFNISL